MTQRDKAQASKDWRFPILKHLTANTKLCSSMAGEGREESSICGGTDLTQHGAHHNTNPTPAAPFPPGSPCALGNHFVARRGNSISRGARRPRGEAAQSGARAGAEVRGWRGLGEASPAATTAAKRAGSGRGKPGREG